jgi:hypothetical protein
MTPSTWKKSELRLARQYGAERISLSGGNNRQGGTRSDTTHPRLFIEVKHGKRFLAIWRLWKEYRALARAERKEPVLLLHPLGAQDTLAVISAERHAALEHLAEAAAVWASAHQHRQPISDTQRDALVNALTRLEGKPLLFPSRRRA